MSLFCVVCVFLIFFAFVYPLVCVLRAQIFYSNNNNNNSCYKDLIYHLVFSELCMPVLALPDSMSVNDHTVMIIPWLSSFHLSSCYSAQFFITSVIMWSAVECSGESKPEHHSGAPKNLKKRSGVPKCQNFHRNAWFKSVPGPQCTEHYPTPYTYPLPVIIMWKYCIGLCVAMCNRLQCKYVLVVSLILTTCKKARI